MNIKITDNNSFIDYINKYANNEYELLSDYINTHIKVELYHKKCKKSFLMKPNNFQQGQRCPYCYGNKKNSFEEVKNRIYNLVKDEYTVISNDENYKNLKTKIKIKHNKCGHEYEVTPSHFLNGRRCPECAKKLRAKNKTKTTDTFKKEVYDLVGNEYEILSEYITSKDYITIKHKKCGFIYNVRPEKFLQNRRCPKCNESKAEKRISVFLEKYNIKFEKEKRFNDCRDERPLPFDFYLPDYDLCIEFDGIQHYQESNFGEGKLSLSKIQYHDQIKNNYCIDNNIGLIRISYKDFDNLEKVLAKDLEEYKKSL